MNLELVGCNLLLLSTRYVSASQEIHEQIPVEILADVLRPHDCSPELRGASTDAEGEKEAEGGVPSVGDLEQVEVLDVRVIHDGRSVSREIGKIRLGRKIQTRS